MSEPEPVVRDFTPPVLVTTCDSGRHIAHPGDTCEEIDELQAVFRAYFERCNARLFAEAHAEADRVWLFGNVTGEMRGFIPIEPEREATPVERAFAILDPELRRCPLYAAGPPALYGPNWKEN